MAKSKIKHIGFEIEGEFSESFERELRTKHRGCAVKGDGSVRVVKNHSLMPREFNSPVLARTSKEVKEIFALFEKAHKANNFNYNESAGFHIHVSFAPEKPPEILSYLFYKTFIENLKAKFPEVLRLRSGNRYCRADLKDDKDVIRASERYKAINFAHSLSQHGTIEFRIFPSETPEKMYAYLEFTINQIRAFINSSHKIEFEHKLPDLAAHVIKHTLTVDSKNIERQFIQTDDRY